jgi:Co/Zn/Cd efflux system component
MDMEKTTVVVTLLNAIILLVAVGSIGYEAAQRFFTQRKCRALRLLLLPQLES